MKKGEHLIDEKVTEFCPENKRPARIPSMMSN